MRASCLIWSQGRDRIRLRQPMILDTWKRAKSAGSPGASNLCRRQASKIIARLRQQLRCLFSSRCRHDDPYILFHTASYFNRAYCLQWQMIFSISRLNKRRDERYFNTEFSRARVSKVDIIFANGQIYIYIYITSVTLISSKKAASLG